MDQQIYLWTSLVDICHRGIAPNHFLCFYESQNRENDKIDQYKLKNPADIINLYVTSETITCEKIMKIF